ncbi:helix-turn-helix domain-containing protein [Sneathiella limimaris]|uniref:AraC-like ligand-binding domain-containing protein n=1 Tax=Sneathiella limimaris TaxID=1964213 RepID=UPI00146AFBBF|nr:helix-turn-helix domain-containing protein [Sneathiella limimaris]
MNVVFSTKDLARANRYNAWRDAICESYVNVEVKATHPEDYRGFIREAEFGDIVLTDILISEQRIHRNKQHIARLDKECFYVQLLHRGNVNVLQKGKTCISNTARGAIFDATEPYELECVGEVHSYYLEIPRDKFAERFPKDQIPVSQTINTTLGLGRIATEFCTMLAKEDERLKSEQRHLLGNQLLDVLAFSLMSQGADAPEAESSIQQARLRSIMNWIEAHISEPNLSLERVARANNISLRYLHLLFQQNEMSVSEWIWNRRLELCYDVLASDGTRSITSTAFDFGFNSSAHFSTLFKRKFGMSPRDVLKPSRSAK